MMNINY